MSRPVKIYVLSFIESVIMKSTALQKSTLVLALLTLSGLAQAADQQARQRYNDEVKHATALYNDDKKLCADAINSAARMQCLRDAKAEYDHAVAKAKANLAQNPGNTSSAPVNNGLCPDCAKVTAVTVSEKEGEGSALGVIAGGVAGALLGNQVGGGTGRDLATIAGAELTRLVSLTIRFTLFKSPSQAACKVAIISIATWRAASRPSSVAMVLPNWPTQTWPFFLAI